MYVDDRYLFYYENKFVAKEEFRRLRGEFPAADISFQENR
jgi:hypothetical protein